MNFALSRRRFLSLTGAASVCALTPGLIGCLRRVTAPASVLQTAATIDGPRSLRARAAARGIFFGCAVEQDRLIAAEIYAGLVRQQAAIVTSEAAMEWATVRPTQEAYRFDAADTLIRLAEIYGLQVHGSALCGRAPMPSWFAQQATYTNARALLTDHIARVAGRYAGRMHSWDVTAAAIHVPDGRSDALRENAWLRLIGAGYLELAFRSAREADPQALLAYSDFGLLTEDQAAHKKRIAVLVLLRRLKARRVPIDALNLMSRLSLGDRPAKELPTFLASVRELGLHAFITDFVIQRPMQSVDPASPNADPTALASAYGDFLDIVLRERAVDVVLTSGAAAPLSPLFDASARPTPVFFAARNAFDRCVLR